MDGILKAPTGARRSRVGPATTGSSPSCPTSKWSNSGSALTSRASSLTATPTRSTPYVLEGEAEFVMGDETVRLGPGSYVAAPVGVVHGFRNVGDRELRMLNVHTPNTGFAVRLRRG